jgi:myo-inositol-1(or 4)-monophosphatase
MVIEMAGSTRLTRLAAEAATAVGDSLRAGFRSRPAAAAKTDRHDLVTAYDKAAEERIREAILAAEPDSVIVGEEGGVTGAGTVVWYVDPIDGTANFAHGLPFFATSIAAAVDDTLVAGAVYDPIGGDLFTASLDGAWCNGHPLVSRGAADEGEALLIAGEPSARHLAADGDRAMARVRTLVETYRTFRKPGSTALALAYVAAGWADVALGSAIHPWDVAAGALLVTAAGGRYLGLRPASSPPDLPAWHSPAYLATVGTLDPLTSRALAAYADTHEHREHHR